MIVHSHFHLLPLRTGDFGDPCGGVGGVYPSQVKVLRDGDVCGITPVDRGVSAADE